MERVIVLCFADEKEVVKQDFSYMYLQLLSSQGAVLAHNEKEYILDKKVIDVESMDVTLYLKINQPK